MAVTEHTDLSLSAWAEVVRAMPTPAALVDSTGRIVVAGRWIDLRPGDQLVIMATGSNVVPGADGNTRWRVQTLRDDHQLYLASVERFSPGDHMLRRFFAATDKLYVVYDQAGHAIEWNSAWKQLLGYSDTDMMSLDIWSLLPPGDADMRAGVEKELRKRGRSEPSWRMLAADGSYQIIQWILLYDPTIGRCFGIGHDISRDARPVEEHHRRAYTDDLTGLASRFRTVSELDRHLRTEGTTPAVLFCDLDQFKVVNDSLGHAVGDQLLASLGERLSSSLDRPDVMVGRLGGDEFAVVIADGGLAAAEAAASQAFDAVSTEFNLAGRSVTVGMSIGICVCEPGVESAAMMFERADMAVYRAKEEGRNRLVIYGAELQQKVDRRFELEAALRLGLEKEEFEPWFQPIMSIRSSRIVGVEALLRWRREGGDVLAPSSFHDVAIESGLITQIGRQMIAQALTEFSTMSSMENGIWLTVNVSARELADKGFTEWFVDRVGSANLRPSQIVIEITESVAIEEHALSDQLTVFRQLGFRIALDDFGTGHSSLAHLRTLPIDIVKIDRTFVADLVEDHTTSALTRSIVDLCRALELDVIFEGVETKPEQLAVAQSGGEYAQGFLYSRPMPVAELQWRTVGAELARRLADRELADPAKRGLVR